MTVLYLIDAKDVLKLKVYMAPENAEKYPHLILAKYDLPSDMTYDEAVDWVRNGRVKTNMYRFTAKLKEGFVPNDVPNLLPSGVKMVDSFEDICYIASEQETFTDQWGMFEWIEPEQFYRTCCG